MTSEEGSAANYQPVKTLVVREDRSNTPGTYVLNGRGHVVNKKGEMIQTAIKPGARVQISTQTLGIHAWLITSSLIDARPRISPIESRRIS